MNGWTRRRRPVDDTSGFDHWRLEADAPGPRVVVLGGVHGDETEGVLAAGGLTRELDALACGSLDVVPVCHEVAFAADSRTSPRDGVNLARVFPGDEGGSPTQRLAHTLTHHVLLGADLLIDLHTSGQSYDMPFLAGFTSHDGDPGGRGERAAAAIGADFLWHHPERSEGRTLSVVDVGIYLESPGHGPTDAAVVRAYVDGVLRVLDDLGMTTRPVPSATVASPIRVTGGGDLDRDLVAVRSEGIFLHGLQAGVAVEQGALLGTVVDLSGSVVERLHAPTDGRVMALKRRSPVVAGDQVVCLATEVHRG